MTDLRAVFERSINERRAHDGLSSVHLTMAPKDPTERETWTELTTLEGGVAPAIAAIHRAKVNMGWARPLTRLLDVSEVADVLGVSRPTLRRWWRNGKLRELSTIRPAGGGMYFREDEVLHYARSSVTAAK
jgi:excisionase family DNA binding protein